VGAEDRVDVRRVQELVSEGEPEGVEDDLHEVEGEPQ
jgi:hypothetical protein